MSPALQFPEHVPSPFPQPDLPPAPPGPPPVLLPPPPHQSSLSPSHPPHLNPFPAFEPPAHLLNPPVAVQPGVVRPVGPQHSSQLASSGHASPVAFESPPSLSESLFDGSVPISESASLVSESVDVLSSLASDSGLEGVESVPVLVALRALVAGGAGSGKDGFFVADDSGVVLGSGCLEVVSALDLDLAGNAECEQREAKEQCPERSFSEGFHL